MAKKTVKQAPHLRVRVDPKLITRLEKATEANGTTLTGEIVARLAESFDAADRAKLLREATEARIQDISASRDGLATELADLRKQILSESAENARLQEQLKKWEERSDLARAIIDTLPEDVPDPLRIMALMLVGDPKAPEAVRSMFKAAAIRARAEKRPLTGTLAATLPAGALSNTTAATGTVDLLDDDETAETRGGEVNEGPRPGTR